MPKVKAGNYLFGFLTLKTTESSNIKNLARYIIVDWGKRQNKALSTVFVEKNKPNNSEYVENEISG